MTRLTPTPHEKSEWLRMSASAYREGRIATGRHYAQLASLPPRASLRVDVFDHAQSDYRAWLVFGEWPAYETRGAA